ncbi:MAG: carboxypeptidase regulatory-like domain-containing protein [Chloracidobacterium sp.]|nr:carboxypeptidase regulatory-like domain-containing protein [Chloracidobacterium sp.]
MVQARMSERARPGWATLRRLLLDINPTYQTGGVYPEVWTLQTVTVTGVPSPTLGRFAFRYFVENGGPTGANSNYIGIDTFAYNAPCGPVPTPTPGVTPTPTPTPPPATPTPTPNPSPSPTCPPGGSASLNTSTVSNNGSGGVFLQLTPATSNLTVTSFDTQFNGAAGNTANVEVWTRPGPYAGFTTSSAGWTLTQTVPATTAGTATNAPVVLTTPLNIPFGGTTSVYLHSVSTGFGIRYFGTGTTSTTTYINADVTMFTDVSRTGAVAFAGSQFTPRAFSGNVNYTTGGSCATPTPTPPPATPTPTPTPPPATPTPTPPPPTPTPSPTPTPTPSIQFSSAAYIEDEGQTATITITRTGDLTGTNTVNYATSNGTATGGPSCTAGIDYVSAAGSVTFNPTETTKTFTSDICADLLTELPNQTVNLTLTGANLGTPNTAVLTINDTATQYESPGPIILGPGPLAPEVAVPIVVSGAPVIIGSMRVTLYDYSHTNPENVDALLVGPSGQAFVMMADAGGNSATGPVTLSFRDAGPVLLADNGPLTTGQFEPTSWTTPIANFPAPAPPGPYSEPGSTIGGTGTQTFFGNYGLTNPNGTWTLHLRQDGPGTGVIQGGWGMEFQVPTAASASISGRVMTADGRPIRNATVTITGNSLMEPRTFQTGTFGYYMFDGLQTGETYVVTVNSRRFTFQVPARVISLIDNVVDADFVADPTQE